MFVEWLLGTAWAGACCAGAMTTLPARVGECETMVVATTVSGEHAFARWDGRGKVVAPSPDEAALVSVAAGWRWSRSAQLQVSAPLRWTWRRAGDLADEGGGFGDLAVGAVWDPTNEHHRAVPVLAIGARLPTGRTWKETDSPLLADVTGLPGPALRLAAAWERTLTRTPWTLAADLEAGPGAPVAWGVSGAVGRTVASDWSLSTGVRHARTLSGEGTGRTTVSAQVVRGERRAWRAWSVLAADVPLPGLGRHQSLLLSASAGLAVVQ